MCVVLNRVKLYFDMAINCHNIHNNNIIFVYNSFLSGIFISYINFSSIFFTTLLTSNTMRPPLEYVISTTIKWNITFFCCIITNHDIGDWEHLNGFDLENVVLLKNMLKMAGQFIIVLLICHFSTSFFLYSF